MRQFRRVKYVLRYQTIKDHPGRPGRSCINERLPECYNCCQRSNYDGHILTETEPIDELDLSRYPGYAGLDDIFCPHGARGGCSQTCTHRVIAELNKAVGYDYFQGCSDASRNSSSSSTSDDTSDSDSTTTTASRHVSGASRTSTYQVREFIAELPRLERPALAIFCNYKAFQEMKRICPEFTSGPDAEGWDEEAALFNGDTPPRVLCFVRASTPKDDDGTASSKSLFRPIYSPMAPSDESDDELDDAEPADQRSPPSPHSPAPSTAVIRDITSSEPSTYCLSTGTCSCSKCRSDRPSPVFYLPQEAPRSSSSSGCASDNGSNSRNVSSEPLPDPAPSAVRCNLPHDCRCGQCIGDLLHFSPPRPQSNSHLLLSYPKKEDFCPCAVCNLDDHEIANIDFEAERRHHDDAVERRRAAEILVKIQQIHRLMVLREIAKARAQEASSAQQDAPSPTPSCTRSAPSPYSPQPYVPQSASPSSHDSWPPPGYTTCAAGSCLITDSSCSGDERPARSRTSSPGHPIETDSYEEDSEHGNDSSGLNLDGNLELDEDPEVAELTARTSLLSASEPRSLSRTPMPLHPSGSSAAPKRPRKQPRPKKVRSTRKDLHQGRQVDDWSSHFIMGTNRKPAFGLQRVDDIASAPPDQPHDSDEDDYPDDGQDIRDQEGHEDHTYAAAPEDDPEGTEQFVVVQRSSKRKHWVKDNSLLQRPRSPRPLDSPWDAKDHVKHHCPPDQPCWCNGRMILNKSSADYSSRCFQDSAAAMIRTRDRERAARVARDAHRARLAEIIAASAYSKWSENPRKGREYFAFDGRPLNAKLLPCYTKEELRILADEGARGYDRLPDISRDRWGRPYEDYPTDTSDYGWLYDVSTFLFDNTLKTEDDEDVE